MKSCILSLTLFVSALLANAQALYIPQDSSYMRFPDNSRIFFQKKVIDGQAFYAMTPKEFRGMIFVTNYLLETIAVLDHSNRIWQRNAVVSDSSTSTREKHIAAEKQRMVNYATSYDTADRSTAATDQRLQDCRDDLTRLNRQRKHGRKLAAFMGAIGGVAVTSLIFLAAGSR